ncbi:hypothetical protein ACF1A5_12885 [Streptomyces sp. NPDC014864]|uniref:hypothetical protein n=1 Tax=Streptomyces sp. NPDC014864 TaxID=3364924 RepID=UPI0036F6D130
MTAADGRHDGVDPLLAALADEPLPPGARADPAFMAAYRESRADLDLIRRHLHIAGDALAQPPEPPESRPDRAGEGWQEGRPADRRQRTRPAGGRPSGSPAPQAGQRSRGRQGVRAFVLGAVGAAAVVAVAAVGSGVLGPGWLAAPGGGNDKASSADRASGDEKAGGDAGAKGDGEAGAGRGPGLSFAAPGYLACARLVVEGDVTGVRPIADTGRERVTLRVTRSYKPARARAEVTFPVDGPGAFRRGDHVLIGIPGRAGSPDLWAVGERDVTRERAAVERALPESAALPCD